MSWVVRPCYKRENGQPHPGHVWKPLSELGEPPDWFRCTDPELEVPDDDSITREDASQILGMGLQDQSCAIQDPHSPHFWTRRSEGHKQINSWCPGRRLPQVFPVLTPKNARSLVLGGTSGIGAACADLLGRIGVKAHALGAEQGDVRDLEWISSAIAAHSPTHVIYSVGVNQLDWIKDTTLQDFSTLFGVNVWGFVSTIQELQKLGYPCSVVAVTSDAARRPMRTSLAYCASKAALDMAVRVASRELAPEGWRINGVAPGKVSGTPMTEYVDARVQEIRGWTAEQASEYEKASSALGRSLTPGEVAAVIVDVLFSDSQGWTGDIISVNGGR